MSGLVRIGSGAGFAGDRKDAAVPVVEMLAACGGPRFLVYETLAERALALCQLARRRSPAMGYSPALEGLIAPVLERCLSSGIRIVGNFGAANPLAAAKKIAAMARALGRCPHIAVVDGADILDRLPPEGFAVREMAGTLLASGRVPVSADAYLGARPIVEALDRGADIVVTGRIADPALVLGPLIHAYRWAEEDWDLLAAGTLAGHLIECGSQVNGGYFADPPFKPVAGLDEVGYPVAEVAANGSIILTKPEGTGGRIDRFTVIEQMLYEIHDPAAYLTPDVVLDLTAVEVAELGPDRVCVRGARGHKRPDLLMATVYIEAGFLAEAEISYAGPGAATRAQLAADVVRTRLARRAPQLFVRVDAIGIASLFNDTAGATLDAAFRKPEAEDVRLRFSAQGEDRVALELLLDEVEALYCAGPAGGAGVRRHLTARLASTSCLVERALVTPTVMLLAQEVHEEVQI